MFYEVLDKYKGSNLTVNRLQELQKKLYFVSNNPALDRKTVAKIAKKLEFNIETVSIV